ncbi:MAG: hypothetical protein KJP06_02825, partial [Deltaproteobacteria bacterium]|nr:hypothetical protein [Deltaproteobacteria bacterium]
STKRGPNDSAELVAGRFKSGAYYSWLKATPTLLDHHIEFYVFTAKAHVGAASCRDIRAF